jgi:hypothetical protein
MLALTAQRGDVAIRSDIAKSYILATDSPSTLADWKEFIATGQVVSVAGKTGVVALTKADVGLGSVENTADSAKPLSTAASTAVTTLASRALAGSGRKLAPPAAAAPTLTTPAYTDLIGMLADGTRKVFTGSSFNASQIGVSTDGAAFTWGKNFAGGNGIATGIVETRGGEVLVSVKHRDNVAGKLWRSTGWNPATADATSWANVLTASGPGVHFDGRWCLTQRSVAPLWSARAGAIFVAEYGNHINEAATPTEAAVRAYMSTNDGATWTTIFDQRNYNTDTNAHIHAIAYDPWDDRVILTVGDNANAGVYWCNGEDLAAPVWTRITGTNSSAAQATTVIPMDSGLVLLSDSPTSGIRRIPRSGYRGYGSIVDALIVGTFSPALIGAHAFQSDVDGPVLLSFYASTSGGAPKLYATSDGVNFSTIHAEAAAVTNGTGLTSVVGPDANGYVWATRNMAGTGNLLRLAYNLPGSQAAMDLKADRVGAADLEVTDSAKGLILKSPGGTRWRLTVGDDGALTTTSL